MKNNIRIETMSQEDREASNLFEDRAAALGHCNNNDDVFNAALTFLLRFWVKLKMKSPSGLKNYIIHYFSLGYNLFIKDKIILTLELPHHKSVEVFYSELFHDGLP